MNFDFGELLARLEDGDRSHATIPAKIWTGRIAYGIGSDIEDLALARCIAADRDLPTPESRVPMLVVLTDRRLLIGQAKRGLLRERGLRRVLGEVPLDCIVAIEPIAVVKEGWNSRSYNRLVFLCMVLVGVLALGEDGVDRGWLLKSVPVWLPDLILNGLLTVVCLVGFVAYIAGAASKYVAQCFVVKATLSNGKSILLQLFGDPDSFLAAFRSVSNHHRSAS